MTVQTYITGETSVNIASSIERAVSNGRLGAGDALPPVRTLASQLGVSPATVAAAYRTLQLRGVLVADGRRGTRVRHAAPLATPAEAPLPEGVRDLAGGNPDLALLPDLARAMQRTRVEQRLYSGELNDPRLVALAREQFESDRVPAQHIAILSGALDGLERVLREQCRPGDRVAVEDPCFTGVLDLLNALSLVAVPVPVDDEGLLPEALAKAMKSCEAVVVTPRAQNPTGAALSARRARELRRVLANKPELLVVEDDHAGPIAGAEYRTLVDGTRERWAVVRSVSKSLGPDLRVALLASDAETHARVEGRQTLGIRWVSHVLQRLVAALMSDKTTQKLLERAERTYTARRQALLAALAKRGIEAHGVSGLNVWIPVSEESATVQALLHAGWGVRAGERYRIVSGPAVRVTISHLDEAEAFADEVERALKRRGRASGA